MPLPALVIPVVQKIVEVIPPKVVITLVVMCFCAYGGWMFRDAKAVEELSEAQAQVIEKVVVETREVERVVTEYVEKDAEVIVKFVEIEKEVDNVQIDNCVNVGAEFVSLFNSGAREASSP